MRGIKLETALLVLAFMLFIRALNYSISGRRGTEGYIYKSVDAISTAGRVFTEQGRGEAVKVFFPDFGVLNDGLNDQAG